ncbi:MAG: NUDIX domain-containing protein, partial [Patescibacteria group bacterium]
NVVWGEKILIGNISYQITGLKPFTNRPFATIGNDWALARQLLSAEQKKEYAKIARAVGGKLAIAGWKGEFGIDVMLDNRSGRLYLIEINARQPASTSCESWLQGEESARNGLMTVFEAHLLALLDQEYAGENLIKIRNGAQIVQKVMLTGKETPPDLVMKDAGIFSRSGWRIIPYEHTEPEQDWIRMQTKSGIMESPGVLNDHGHGALSFSLSTLHDSRFGLKRAGVIVTKNKKILLFRRHHFGTDYYSVPGGRQDHPNETLADTARRELNEELNLDVRLSKSEPIKVSSLNRDEFYFFAESYAGEPRLSGEELERNSADNSYIPEWVNFKKLKEINLLPLSLKKKLIKILK